MLTIEAANLTCSHTHQLNGLVFYVFCYLIEIEHIDYTLIGRECYRFCIHSFSIVD